MKAHETFLAWSKKLEDKIKTLTVALKANDVPFVLNLLENLVTDYQPSKEIVDWVYVNQGQDEANL